MNETTTKQIASQALVDCRSLDHAFILFIGEESEAMDNWLKLRMQLLENIIEALTK